MLEQPPRCMRHDAETFRVAEELMMLSNCVVTSSVSASPTEPHLDKLQEFSGRMEKNSVKNIIKREPQRTSATRKRQKALSTIFDHVQNASTKQHKANGTSGHVVQAQEPATRPTDILNSRCDVSHSELLQEHRSRFRRVRRRWTTEQRIKNRAYVARFEVQGVPLRAGRSWTEGRLATTTSVATAASAFVLAGGAAGSGVTGLSDGDTYPHLLASPSSLFVDDASDYYGSKREDTTAAWTTSSGPTAAATGARHSSSSMGNYDREAQWRIMQQNQQQHQPSSNQQPMRLHHQVHGAIPSGSIMTGNGNQHTTTGGPYYPSQLNDSERRHLVNAMQGVYSNSNSGSAGTGASNFGYFHPATESPSAGKRPRLSSTTSSSGGSTSTYGRGSPMSSSHGTTPTAGSTSNNNSTSSNANNNNNSSYLRPMDNNPYVGYHQAPLSIQTNTTGYERDNPLPDFNQDWFLSRLSPVTSSNFGGNGNLNSTPGNNGNGSGGLDISSASGANNRLFPPLGLGSPNSSLLGGVELIPEYESGFYSLWNGSNGANIMGYDNDSEPRNSGPGTTTPSSQIYLPEDELKIDYPQLSELNQGDFDYLYGPMESGNQTPTTPSLGNLGTALAKQELTDLAERRHREPQVPERPVPTSSYRKRKTRVQDEPRSTAVSSATNVTTVTPTMRINNSDKPNEGTSNSGFRSMARNATIETKRPLHNHQQQPLSQLPTSSAPNFARSTPSAAANTALNISPPVLPVPFSTRLTPTAQPISGEIGDDVVVEKRPRSRQCDFPGCLNRARSHQKCKKHGGAHQCVYEGCTKNSQSRGLCIAHGGGSRCKVEGCVRAAQSKGLCKSHGGGEFCAVEGCRKKAHLKHLCRNHGGGVRCKNAKCAKWAQRKGWCMAHAKEILGS
uniref:WRKY19-like zinc finger domain-containing protein n=1 Tax=Globisporangium ultimum (strain ATCC 200006 / CBS 805.95 / DAOM BR144) TaxID=431595 RepID=K3WTS2_GLOUD